ncbi:MAG: DUF3078 domain-containing protein [Arcicella sp.]|jgi:hypothetical protein|nr:DUF3078 domain-containing protein [Arcicella sp.]
MKKHISLFVAFALLFSMNLFAQEVKKDTSYWKKSSQFGANFSNAQFSNFVAGGQNATGFNVFFNTKGEYAKDKTTWVNDLQLQYGILDNGTGIRKSIDRIFFDTKVGRKLSKTWSFVGGVNFQTQFTAGYTYGATSDKDIKISSLFAPAFITEYIGLEWKPKPFFNVVFAPGAMRQTIVADDDVRPRNATGQMLPAYGVPVGKSLQNDIGIMQIVATFDKDIAKNVNLKLRYQLFMDAKKIANMDNRLDAKLAAKINKYFSATFDLILLYDDDQSFQIQQARNLGLGFLYTF